MDPLLIAWGVAFVVVVFGTLRLIGTTTIYEYQRGIFYRNGAITAVRGAGRYRYLKSMTDVQIVDVRKTLMGLPGQEILTKDNVNLKISLVGFYEVTDPVRALHSSQSFQSDLYSLAQIALRDLVAQTTMDELLESKSELDAKLQTAVADGAASLGIMVSQLAVKDIMLPPNLKRAFSAVLEAKREAQRQLEQARGEQAVLRSLANSSGMYEGNPALLQARLVQALSTGNNSIVFGADDKIVVKKANP
ncbi:MAG TPA: slipin family protein [Rhizomicrobium sp.]|jgi:regulator of protease activity HflC (stomatin/prohibitin superfamily)|nr:slipin family protein [Rhizomicrobium sp.]